MNTVNPILSEHQHRNLKSRDFWDAYAPHREIITQQILSALPNNSGTVCLLGAGNCNDVDLPQIAATYQRIHLVDLDGEALTHAIESAPEATKPKLTIHPSIDTTGIAVELAKWIDSQPSAEAYRAAIQAASTAKLNLSPERFDVVVSCCLLSQLIDSLVLTGVPQDALFLELLLAIRDRHIDQVWESTKPGGTSIVVSDFISTVALPQLEQWTAAQLAQAFPQLIERRNFFTGLNPVVLRNKLAEKEPSIEPTVEGPWIWSVGRRKFGVCSVTARHRP